MKRMSLLLLLSFLINFDFKIQAATSEKESKAPKATISKELDPYILGPLANIVKEYLSDKIILRFEARDEKEKEDFEIGFGMNSAKLLEFYGILKDSKDSEEEFSFRKSRANFKVNQDIDVFPLSIDIGDQIGLPGEAIFKPINNEKDIPKNINNFLVTNIWYNSSKVTALVIKPRPGHKYIVRHAPCKKEESNYKIEPEIMAKHYCIQEIKLELD